MTWQPIETAPKDETEFQAWVIHEETGAGWWEPRARYNAQGALEFWGRVDYDYDDWGIFTWLTATHWMPQPAPPEVRA